jgi:nucleotide-binding universal stress UspA family protein
MLVAVDFSEHTEKVLTTACELAKALEAKLWIIHVSASDPEFVGYQPGPDTVRDQVAAHLREEHHEVHALGEKLRQEGFDAIALSIQGPTVEAIVSEIRKLAVDLAVIGSHGHGAVYRLLLGSVSEGVLRKVGCPLLIVPSGNHCQS